MSQIDFALACRAQIMTTRRLGVTTSTVTAYPLMCTGGTATTANLPCEQSYTRHVALPWVRLVASVYFMHALIPRSVIDSTTRPVFIDGICYDSFSGGWYCLALRGGGGSTSAIGQAVGGRCHMYAVGWWYC